MNHIQAPTPIKKPQSSHGSILGALAGLGAALGYTAANAFLRALATEVDPAWVSAIKAACTVTIFGPWLILLSLKKYSVVPPFKVFAVLIMAGIVVQLGGNLAYQISLGSIGLALAVPILMGSMIVSTALIGRLFLSETITMRLAIALGVLIVSIAILSFGAERAREGLQSPQSVQTVLGSQNSMALAVFGACLSGFSFALLGISIRWSTKNSPLPLATPMVIVGLCGVFSLGAVSWVTSGPEVLLQTSAIQWRFMLLAGLCNSCAFLALTYALKMLPAIYVNAINVTQVAMAAVLGIVVFGERLSGYLVIGSMMMIFAFSIMRRNRPVAEKLDGARPTGGGSS